MIKNRASHSDVDLGELETCLTESTTNVYVYEDYGDLSKYEQAWKIDKLVWDKFCEDITKSRRIWLTESSWSRGVSHASSSETSNRTAGKSCSQRA